MRGLRGDRIAHAILRVQPEAGRGLETSAEGYQQVLCDVTLSEAGELRFGTVDIDVQIGLIEGLLDT